MSKSPAVVRFQTILRGYGVIYCIGAVIFFFVPELLITLLNGVGEAIGLARTMPVPEERFWVVLSTAMMVMLVGVSFAGAARPGERAFVYLHIAAKVTSTAGYLYLFVLHDAYFTYLVGAITDLPIAVIVFLAARQAWAALEREGAAA
jgi:hypothetical protein